MRLNSQSYAYQPRTSITRKQTSQAGQTSEELIVEKFIGKFAEDLYTYKSICHLFISLAQTGRRPVVLMREATDMIAKIDYQNEILPTTLLLETLKSLASLNYPHPKLVESLIGRLSKNQDIPTLSYFHKSSLLRTMDALKWRSDDILNVFVENMISQPQLFSYQLFSGFINTAANLNFNLSAELVDCYKNKIKPDLEPQMSQYSRSWLKYVYSLTNLGLADDGHLRSVLSKDHYVNIQNPKVPSGLATADVVRLLNLRAIALYDEKLQDLSCEHLNHLTGSKIPKNIRNLPWCLQIHKLFDELVGDKSKVRHDIHTPFGFAIDSELEMDKKQAYKKLDTKDTIEERIQDGSKARRKTSTRCAVMYVPFDESLINPGNEILGRYKLLSRILGNFEYKVIFVTQKEIRANTDSAKTMVETILGKESAGPVNKEST